MLDVKSFLQSYNLLSDVNILSRGSQRFELERLRADLKIVKASITSHFSKCLFCDHYFCAV